jgi:hypothetical protein
LLSGHCGKFHHRGTENTERIRRKKILCSLKDKWNEREKQQENGESAKFAVASLDNM